MKYLAIDIGQVICHLDFRKFNAKLAAFTGMTEKEAYDFLLNSQKAHDLGFSILEKDLNNKFYGLNLLPDQVREIVKEWHNSLIPNPIVIKWLEKLLSSKEFKIALVSNIGYEHTETMKTILSSIYNDENIIRFFSCFVGARKPNYTYYQTFLNMYPNFKGCTYLDDNQDNIESGKLFGFNSIVFDISKMSNEEIALKLTEVEGKYV